MSNRGKRTGKTLDMIADIESGMTVKEVAAKYGVSPQNIYHLCDLRGVKHHRTITEKECVYPNIRKWMNDNKVSRGQFIRMMGMSYHTTNLVRLRETLNGSAMPRKDYIDSMLKTTGMTYEELFYMGDES